MAEATLTRQVKDLLSINIEEDTALSEEEINAPLTAEEEELLLTNEKVIRDGFKSFLKVGQALLEIKAKKLFRKHGYKTFSLYLRNHFGNSPRQARNLMSATKLDTKLRLPEESGTAVPFFTG